MVLVTGVSGSGKSSLVNDVLVKTLQKKLYRSRALPGAVDRIEGLSEIDYVIKIDQSPIGRTPRSNPATYTGVFDNIRDLFAETVEAKVRGYSKGRFSFNVKGGRCEKCSGDGVIKIEMHFLPDVYIPCEECRGTRYNSETLEVKYKGKNIYDVLEMTIEEACGFFENISTIKPKIETLRNVGLGYVKLGQSATSLSGGEAQRVKLASELYKRITDRTLFILDEPTTGLHTDDVKRLLEVLNYIVDHGATVVIIEHNLDVIKQADYIIDLGPEGGYRGGEVIVCGTVQDIINCERSFTGKYLKKVL
jgi:excinuclease ABC subunit A